MFYLSKKLINGIISISGDYMHKTLKNIIDGILFIAIIVAFILIGTKDFNTEKEVDNEKFDQDYTNVSANNVFKYVNASEVYTLMRSQSGVLLMGYPQNKWTGPYASILNDVAQEVGLKEILYYDFYEDREVKNAIYQSIALKLGNYLPTLDDGTKNIYAPTLIIVKNGQVIYYDAETSIINGIDTPENYWNEFKVVAKKNNLKTVLTEYLNSF